MKRLLAVLGVVPLVILAAPAHADPGGANNDAAFLASLKSAGITYGSPDQAIAAGKAVCGLVADGESGLEVIENLQNRNPQFTLGSAAKFAGLAARAYCPQQLKA